LDERYAINAAKTEMREAYNHADVERILAIYADILTDMSDGQPSFYGPDAKPALRARLENLFREYHVEFVPTVIGVRVAGDLAVDYGWHSLTLRPKAGGPPVGRRTRYFEIWNRDALGLWRIVVFTDNADQQAQLLDEVLMACGEQPSAR
jgi:ketosteroid isomerase-like protein